ncbi:conserved hypothetical protein [uncultured Desulfovibrio sp.]|uniref:Uncharacterized protein n=1 Tax=uncultured Desulfovibrio sp. TaxID=167968 RepID=A0A212IX44_9BACT|nr:hypothetical protein [uncultured Desulfovibrio sp.]SBV91744.1 conserved hypothetical protein [uncultured Desulfovibrio sp.]
MGIQRSDLVYEKSYIWKVLPNDNPKITGKPDSTLLNRNEGYEVLDFINNYMKTHKLSTVAEGQKVEKMIRNDVPKHIHSHSKISEWIADNWNK